jgi:hypothetical protein
VASSQGKSDILLEDIGEGIGEDIEQGIVEEDTVGEDIVEEDIVEEDIAEEDIVGEGIAGEDIVVVEDNHRVGFG